MNLYTDISQVTRDNNTVITIGTFDGFHLGHQKIINELLSSSRKNNWRNLVITFEPHPRSVLSKDYNIQILTTLEEKKELISEAGIENLFVINFTKEFSELSYEEFFTKYIVHNIGISELVIGHDHKLGKDRSGNEDKLTEFGRQHGFSVTPVSAVEVNGEVISSTKIRHALRDGEINKANHYLGRPYSFSGTISRGAARGRTLGFPTANVVVGNDNKSIPASGIYVAEMIWNGQNYYGLMNIGLRPTFGDVDSTMIEIYLYDFNKNIYYEKVKVNVIERMRDEKKFSSKEELIVQMNLDKEQGLKIINNLINNKSR